MEWQYYITPGFIARMRPGNVEICRLDNDQWDDKTFDSQIQHMIEEDGYGVPEEEAIARHREYKKIYTTGKHTP